MVTQSSYLVGGNNTSPTTTTLKPARSPFTLSDDKKYTVAKVARQKLMIESSFRDHDLRKLVGHANLVDRFIEEYSPQPASSYEVTCVQVTPAKSPSSGDGDHKYILQAQQATAGGVSTQKSDDAYAALTRQPSHAVVGIEVEECEVSEEEDD